MAQTCTLAKLCAIILALGLNMTAVSALPTVPTPLGMNTTSGVPLATAGTEAPDMLKTTYSGLAVGLLVSACIMAAVFLVGLLWMRCSAFKRREHAPGDVELQEIPRRSASGQPAQGSSPDSATPRKRPSGSYERWRKQRDSRKKEHKDWVKKKRAEMAAMRLQSRNQRG